MDTVFLLKEFKFRKQNTHKKTRDQCVNVRVNEDIQHV